ncbi:MAG: zinc ribbon domain-containing protein [Myxococcota bacterium]|jgi:hypothetical protein|nr:zinc ribbon domain-containing protein [Myxococcota bacterium]
MYCPQCGVQNDDNAFRCIQCGSIVQQMPMHPGAQGGYGGAAYDEPSKADMALILAVLGWVVCVLVGVAAIPMARGEIRAIEEGRRDPAKLGTAKAAFWIAMIQLVIFGLSMVAVVFFLALGAAI